MYSTEKNLVNILKHGVSFDEVEYLDWDSAVTAEDVREDYEEIRYISYALLSSRLHCLVWTERDSSLRPISFRKANKRELRYYYEQKK